MPTTATFMYNDLVLRNVASFLYFWDNIDRFCAFVSSSVTKDMLLNESYKLYYNMWGNSNTAESGFIPSGGVNHFKIKHK